MHPSPWDKEHYNPEVFSFLQRYQARCKTWDDLHEDPDRWGKEIQQGNKI